MKRDMRRLSSLDLTIRAFHICRAMGLKTAHSIRKVDWDSKIGTKAKWYKDGQFVISYPIGRKVVEELKSI